MSVFLYLFVTAFLPSYVFLNPATESSLVITTTINDSNDAKTQETSTVVTPPELKSMHVESNISNRYAYTTVSSRYKNPADIAQETTFSIILPETAFISGFLMKTKGKVYEAYVKEKEEAKKEYDLAVQSGLSAGYVEQNARDSNKFTISVNVEPRSKIVFNLTYEELLMRRHGRYEMIINLHPGQLVKDLTVDVNINETKKLVNVRTPALRSGNEIVEDNEENKNEYAIINKVDEEGKCVKVHFAPNVQQQKEMAKKLEASKVEDPVYGFENEKKNQSDKGLAGQFVIEYDVERDSQGGEILVNDGYFVHFFSPADLKPLPKHAVFVLDVSGSMSGRKIEQLKEAMNAILDELKPNDYFNLVEFSFGAKVWNFDDAEASPTFEESRKSWWRPPDEVTTPKTPQELPPAFLATTDNKKKAKQIVENMTAGGGTNIYDALKVALNLTSSGIPETTGRGKDVKKIQPIVIFLTDGDATDGETDAKVIFHTVSELNDKNAAVFSLSFGYDANKEFLKQLSLKNNGFMRQIYEAADAPLQLQDFYKEISSPLLANVTFKYPDNQVESLTKHSFHTLFDGGEFIVAGKMESSSSDNILYVHGLTLDGPIDFPPHIVPIPDNGLTNQHQTGSLERLWAYMTIKELLDKKVEISVVGSDGNSTEAEDLKKQALKLALKYSFVTPVTSLVVVKPNETEKVNTEESKKAEGIPAYGPQTLPLNAPVPVLGSASGFGGGIVSGWGKIDVNYDVAPAAPPMFARHYPTTPLYAPGVPGFAATESVQYFAEEESEVVVDSGLDRLAWLGAHSPDPDRILIEGKDYFLGNNLTTVEEKSCRVEKLNMTGNCTLLSACPRVFIQLETFEIFAKEYFCKLTPSFAGVCCINIENKEEENN